MNNQLQVEERTFLKRIDFKLSGIILALNILGLVNLYSATHGVHSTSTNLFMAQIVWLLMGWMIFFVITFIDYKFFIRIAYVVYGTNLVALLLVQKIGKTFYGAQRWLDLGFFRYQPSETMKLAVVLVFARLLAKRASTAGLTVKELLFPLALLLIPFLITAKQPDLGSALLIVAIGGTLLLFVGIRWKLFVTGCIVVLFASVGAWEFVLRDYQKNRIETFLNPGKDPRGAGYNSIQSKIAVGSGQLLGKGFMKGTQSQLEFLPERHTDFIFSVLSEEHGLLGSFTTIALFGILFTMGIGIARRARDRIGVLIVVGVLGFIFWHVFINIGMVIGIFPIVGIPLPLLSYGGSGVFSIMVGLGLISSVAYRRYLF